MIQRMQSVWLVLAAAAAFLTLKCSFFSGNILAADNKTKVFTQLNATSNIIILLLTATLGMAASIAIFLYKNRKLQLRITLAALAVSIITIVLYYLQTRKFVPQEGNYSITALLSLLVPVLLILAARGIGKDQKLVKSLDRLR